MAYSLLTSYAGESLLSGFNWINTVDPSHGYVAYQSQEEARTRGLYSVDPDTQVVRLGVDHQHKYGLGEGRPSIRLESKEAYNHGLMIADFLHMPASECGVWPAFWTYGANWPHGGELDIIEGTSLARDNVISAHTGDGCFLDPADDVLSTGTARNHDCGIGTQNIGCGYDPPANDTSSYGTNFNQAKGGVYAVLWDSEYLRVWHFPRHSIPSDIHAKQPDPRLWGLPQASFGGDKCDVDSYFKDMNIVININFCGDYGDATWNDFPSCKALASTCDEHVGSNPEAFANAYWDVKYIDVYESTGLTPLVLDKEDFTSESDSTLLEPTATALTTTLSTSVVAVSEDASATTVAIVAPVVATPVASTLAVSTPVLSTSVIATFVISTSVISTPIMNTPVSATPVATTSVIAAPVATACNKPKVDGYTYLGCLSSSSGFPTFELTLESGEMTVERCINACDGLSHVGIFERKCYCAEGIDKDTHTLADPSACDHVCPGDETEFCGGLSGFQNNGTARRNILGRDAPCYYLLSAYANLSNNEGEALPPPMKPAPGIRPPAAQHALTTTVTYTIPCPTDPHTLVATEYVATVEDCGCTEQPPVPMETKVVDCQACGPGGEDTVTVTIPVTAVKNIELSAVLRLTPIPEPGFTSTFRIGGLNLTAPKRYQPVIAMVTPAPNAPIQVSGSGWKRVDSKIAITVLVAAVCAMLV